MSISHKDNCMHVECDTCDRQEEIYFGDWTWCWEAAKADGWRAWKDQTDAWCHSCPTCTGLEIPA